MANDPVDLLQIKIEKAKAELPTETLNAIAAVDWKAAILGLRASRGYTFEQLGDLELETELLLSGLVSPSDYPKELKNRMRISEAEANQLANEMNNLVFIKIQGELIKNAERKKVFTNNKAEEETNTQILNTHGIEIIGKPTLNSPLEEYSDLGSEGGGQIVHPPRPSATPQEGNKEERHPILAQKVSGSFKTPVVKTEYSLNNISKTGATDPISLKPKIPGADPYREVPE